MKGNRKRRDKQNNGFFQMFLFLFLLNLLLFTFSQLTPPTGASFNSVTMIEWTISTDDTFMNVEIGQDDTTISEMEGDKQEDAELYSEKAEIDYQSTLKTKDGSEHDNEGETDFKLD